MTVSQSRRIELARQIEEMRLLHSESRTELTSSGRRRGLNPGAIDERLARQEGIIRTLEFLRDNEADIRAWALARSEPLRETSAHSDQRQQQSSETTANTGETQ